MPPAVLVTTSSRTTGRVNAERVVTMPTQLSANCRQCTAATTTGSGGDGCGRERAAAMPPSTNNTTNVIMLILARTSDGPYRYASCADRRVGPRRRRFARREDIAPLHIGASTESAVSADTQLLVRAPYAITSLGSLGTASPKVAGPTKEHPRMCHRLNALLMKSRWHTMIWPTTNKMIHLRHAGALGIAWHIVDHTSSNRVS
jgi:hypothetical protein